MATRQQFANSVSWNTLTVVLQVVIQVVYTGILARLLSPDSFALMGIVLSIMGFAELFAQVGVGPALIQRKEIHQQHINGAFYTAIILGTVFTLLFVLSAPLFARIYEIELLEPIIQVVCSSFVISAFAVVPRAMMMREMRFRVLFKASMISIVGGNLVVGLTLAWLGWNVWAYVWALFAQNALMTIALWWYQPVKVTRLWKWENTRELIGYGMGSSLFNALNYFATKMDVMLVPYFSKSLPGIDQGEQLRRSAMYERSNYIMTQPITIMGKLSDSVLFSGMSRLQDDHARLHKTMLVSTNLIACVVVPATIFICFFAEPIMTIWLGDQYGDAVAVLQVLILAVIFRTLSKLCDSLLRAKGAVYRGSWYKLIYVLLIGGGIVLAMPYGMTMVAAAIVGATLIHYLMSMHLVTQLIGVPFSRLIQALWPAVQLGLLAALISWSVALLNDNLQLPKLVLLGVGGLAMAGGLALLIFMYPGILGGERINPLTFLPEKLKGNRFVKRMIQKL
ncbi:MAG: lipopolysaccharide biosynthesis protein [Flavobacteriales bacterium]